MRCKCLCALGVFALCVTVYAADAPQSVERITLEGVSVINEITPLPPGADRANTLMQPFGVPVPIYRVLSEEEMARGGTANTGAATAIVYRNSHDMGSGNFNKGSAAGNHVGNLLHLGNAFPVDGGEIKGYDLLVYNSVSNPEPANASGAIAHVSLWNGDPLGIIDTRITDPPQMIAGTDCTFTNLAVQGGDDTVGDCDLTQPQGTEWLGTCIGGFADGDGCNEDNFECGLCAAEPGDDIAECPGLYRLVCNLDPKVTIPSRNVWMILNWEGGCRMGWRWAYLEGPEIAAVGEENFCAGTCPAAPVPCVDLAIEVVDAASQYSGMGTGTCCESGDACDHTIAITCGHATSCSDGTAEYFSGWCFGAPSYFASFVASIYANTDTTVSVVPVGGGNRVGDDEIALVKGDVDVTLEVYLAGWAHPEPLPRLKVWQTQLDASGYTSALRGELTIAPASCTGLFSDCPGYELGEPCEDTDGDFVGDLCPGTWQWCFDELPDGEDHPFPPPDVNACMDLPACDTSTPDVRCGSTSNATPPMVDPGVPVYAMSHRVHVPADAAGTFTLGLLPDPQTFLKDQNSGAIPLVGYVPGKITVEVGQCCDMSVPYPFVCVTDTLTANECAAEPYTSKFDPDADCGDPCGCENDGQCDDSNACTDDTCENSVCVNTLNYNDAIDCCDEATGITCPIDDGNDCTADSCDAAGCVHTPHPTGTPCDDGIDCDTVVDVCDGAGGCAGTPIFQFPCTSDADCLALHLASSCDTIQGICICQLPEITCDIHGSDKANEMCLDQGEKYLVDVNFINTPPVVTGGQFALTYDPTCLDFVSIGPGGDPFTFEIEEIVDEASGYIFYAVGIDPFGGVGVAGSGTLATISFNKIGVCNSCSIVFGGDNPQDTVLATDEGQAVLNLQLGRCGPVYDNEDVHLIVPPDVKANAGCDASTADVSWDPPSASADCDAAVDLICAGSHETGWVFTQDEVYNGGEMPQGISTFCCTATSAFCGHEVSDCWTVEVNDASSFDLTLQLNPQMAGDVERCITFELFNDCSTAPIPLQQEIFFGGIWDHVGHYTDIKKIPPGQYFCVTAMDQQHSLRASAMMSCVDGVYEAVFKGDPFNSGNWLVQGNLDAVKKDNPLASHDVIDILDFAMFAKHYMDIVNPNTLCADKHEVHADINGDGVVDSLDFSFIMANFMAHSKNACCPDAAASDTGLTSVTVRELRQMGMGDLAVADLNSDGVVDSADITAFMNGAVPVRKAPIRDSGSRLGTR